jgi:hypothetical protein
MRDGGLSKGISSLLLTTAFVAVASHAAANGAAFFRPAGKGARVDLGYVGTIRDVAGRRLNFADVTVIDKNLGLTFPFANDAPGHFRSPDIGALIKEGGQIVDPPNLEISCFVVGYKMVTRPVPRKSRGILQVDFVMIADPNETVRTPPEPPSTGKEGTAQFGIVALLATAVAARTAVRRRTTDD